MKKIIFVLLMYFVVFIGCNGIDPTLNNKFLEEVYRGNIDSVSALLPGFLRKGADINAKNDNGLTALDITYIYTGNKEMEKLLLDNGAKITDNINNLNVKMVRTDFGTFETALDAYYLNHNKYPTTEEGLKKLIEDGLLKNNGTTLLDPWKNEYQYRNPGKFSENPEIFSFGADGKLEGDSYNADIINWK